jgi:beta-glucanase (GH16 family)
LQYADGAPFSKGGLVVCGTEVNHDCDASQPFVSLETDACSADANDAAFGGVCCDTRQCSAPTPAPTEPTTVPTGVDFVVRVANSRYEITTMEISAEGSAPITQDQPSITLVRGSSYIFDVDVGAEHPFWIKSSAVLGENGAYNTGIDDGAGQKNRFVQGQFNFTVDPSAPDTLTYICQYHDWMVGTINIVDGVAPVNPTSSPSTGPTDLDCSSCEGPYPSHDGCEGRVQWLMQNWNSVTWTQDYADHGVDGSRCSAQAYLNSVEPHCPPVSSDCFTPPAPIVDSTEPSRPCGSACSSAEWDLVWSDEFDGSALNRSKWDHEVDCAGGGNNEMQCYTAREENVRLDGEGHLLIEARAEEYAGSASDGSCTYTGDESWKCTAQQPFTSGRLRTRHHASWKYGRFDVRAKLPAGHGMWPAIWMLPTDGAYGGWPHSGEIDIMEARGGDVGVVGGTLHYGNGWPNNENTGTETSLDCVSGGDFTADFHVYSVVWTEEAITWMVDGIVFHTEQLNGRSFGSRYSSGGKPFDQDFHIILNVAIGGNYFGSAGVQVGDVRLLQPAMVVDYVRVYQSHAHEMKVQTGTFACRATREGSAADVCGAVQWACEQFQSIDGLSCSGHEWGCSGVSDAAKFLIADIVFDRYYQHSKDAGGICDFSGKAALSQAALSQAPLVVVACRATREGSAADLCGAVQWACEQFQSIDGLSCSGHEWGCSGVSDAAKFLIADVVFDRYYQHAKDAGGTCDFSGKAALQEEGGDTGTASQDPKGVGSSAMAVRSCKADREGSVASVCGVVTWTCEQFQNMADDVSCSGSEWACSYADDGTKWSIADAVFDRHYQAVKGNGGTCIAVFGEAECPEMENRCCVASASTAVQASFDVALAAETVESFDAAKQQNFKVALATVLGAAVAAADITLTVTADPAASSRRNRHRRALATTGIIVTVQVAASATVATAVEAIVGGATFTSDLQNEAVLRGVMTTASDSYNSLSVDALSFTRSAHAHAVGVAELPPTPAPPTPAPVCVRAAFQSTMVNECAAIGTTCQTAVHSAKGTGTLSALKSAFGCSDVSGTNACVNFIVCVADALGSSGCPLTAMPPKLQRLKFTRDQVCNTTTAGSAEAEAVCEASPC